MSHRLQDKVAIVTGSSSGVGRAIATLYAKEGAYVVCADLTPEARLPVNEEDKITTHELIEQIAPGRSEFKRTDVTVPEQMEALVSFAVDRFERLDVMVNNAGISIEARNPRPVHECSIETFDTTMAVNTRSVFLGCKYAAAQMLRQKPYSSGDRGWIVNISSIYGVVGAANSPAYSASKGAVSNLTRAVAMDYLKDKIHVNALCPGHIQTAIFQETTNHMVPMDTMNSMYPFKGPGRPEDVAKMAVVLASDDSSWMTGGLVPVDGGFTCQ